MSCIYKDKSGMANRKGKEKREQEKAKLQKLDTYVVHCAGDEPDFFVGSDSGPPKLPGQLGNQVNYS